MHLHRPSVIRNPVGLEPNKEQRGSVRLKVAWAAQLHTSNVDKPDDRMIKFLQSSAVYSYGIWPVLSGTTGPGAVGVTLCRLSAAET